MNSLILFDLSVKGHHPSYIRYLIQYWQKENLTGTLNIVVSPQFIQEHADVVGLADFSGHSQIKFIAITEKEAASLKTKKSPYNRILRYFQEWKILKHYAVALKAKHCLIMYFDTYILPLNLGSDLSCFFSGIYFRPTFHYSGFTDYPLSLKEKVQKAKEIFFISRVLKNQHLQYLFCLDSFAIPHLNQLNKLPKSIHLPDPVELTNKKIDPKVDLRKQLGISPSRKIFLLFGAITERKGVCQLLEAIQYISPELCQKICLLLVGESNIKSKIQPYIEKLSQESPIQILTQYEFICDEDVKTYYQLADVILAPYQRHVGMSGILLLAAVHQKPVLSSDYGLMGELVSRHQLGITVDSTKPQRIAEGIGQFFIVDPKKLYNLETMDTFARQNSSEEFARVIFDHLLDSHN